MSEFLFSGRPCRLQNVFHEGNRDSLAINVDFFLPSTHVVPLLEDLVARNAEPQWFECDNGPEFTAEDLRAWFGARGIALAFSEPCEPSQNDYVERLCRTLRDEVLDSSHFRTLDEVPVITNYWRHRNNSERTHENVGDVPPRSYLTRESHLAEFNLMPCA